MKAIPKARDRIQSRLLVAAATPVLLWIAWQAMRYAGPAGRSGSLYLIEAAAVSLFFALAAFRLRAATAGAAVCGALICFDLTVLTGRPDGGSVFHSGLSPLLLLFVLTHAATRFRREQDYEEKRGRNAAQVVANLGIAAGASMPWHLLIGHRLPDRHVLWLFTVMLAPMLAALAEASADTVSSEIGQAIGGTPFLLTTFRRVARGTDGAISAAGTLAGITAAAVITLVGIPALGMTAWIAREVFIAAVAGFFFDSLLGATLERRGWIGNDLVNFTSTAFTAALCFALLSGQIT